MATLITDPHLEESLKIQRHAWGADRFDEVWEGVYIMSPQPNVEHQELVSDLVGALRNVIRPPQGGKVYPGINLSDRRRMIGRIITAARTWPSSLPGKSPARNSKPTIAVQADFLVEVVSANDDTRKKIPF